MDNITDSNLMTVDLDFPIYQSTEETKDEPYMKKNAKYDIWITRLKYYVRILSWLPQYKIEYLKGDFPAGIATGVLLVPQAIAYSLIAGLPPISGLQAAFYSQIFYLLLGTTNQLSIGPEAIISIMVGSCLDNFTMDQSERQNLASILTLEVGIITLILGILRFGFITTILSRSMLGGFINAVAIEVILEQADKFFGLRLQSHSYYKLAGIYNSKGINIGALFIGIASLGILITLGMLKSKFPKTKLGQILLYIPSSLVVVSLGIILSSLFGLSKFVPVLGSIDSGLVAPKLDTISLNQISSLTTNALFISIIGIVESSLIGRNCAQKYGYRLSINRELVALGVANMGSSIFSVFPSFGSLPRSSLNDNAGAKTLISSFVTNMIVLISIFLLLPLFSYLPTVIMGSIIVMAAVGLFEIRHFIFLWKIRAWTDIGLFLLAFLTTLIFGVELGIVVTILTSILLVAKETSNPYITIMKPSQEQDKYEEYVAIRDVNLLEGNHHWLSYFTSENSILIVRIEESLYFANIQRIRELFQKIEQASSSPYRGIILDASHILNIDPTSIKIIIEMVEEWKKRGIIICFVNLRSNLNSIFIHSGLTNCVGVDRMISTTSQAVKYITQYYESHSLHSTQSEINIENTTL